jgi:hypothetical protein
MLFWHVGASVAFIRYAFRDPMMDIRFLAVGAVLADLVDLPIGILAWSTLGSPRLVAHSMAFAFLAMVLVAIFTRRGSVRKKWILLAVGLLLHLALDAMWRSPETLWWPLFGWGFTSSGVQSFGAYAANVLTSPWMWAGEAIGLIYLVVLWRKSAMSTAGARSRFMDSGVVSAPIDRS